MQNYFGSGWWGTAYFGSGWWTDVGPQPVFPTSIVALISAAPGYPDPCVAVVTSAGSTARIIARVIAL